MVLLRGASYYPGPGNFDLFWTYAKRFLPTGWVRVMGIGMLRKGSYLIEEYGAKFIRSFYSTEKLNFKFSKVLSDYVILIWLIVEFLNCYPKIKHSNTFDLTCPLKQNINDNSGDFQQSINSDSFDFFIWKRWELLPVTSIEIYQLFLFDFCRISVTHKQTFWFVGLSSFIVSELS